MISQEYGMISQGRNQHNKPKKGNKKTKTRQSQIANQPSKRAKQLKDQKTSSKYSSKTRIDNKNSEGDRTAEHSEKGMKAERTITTKEDEKVDTNAHIIPRKTSSAQQRRRKRPW